MILTPDRNVRGFCVRSGISFSCSLFGSRQWDVYLLRAYPSDPCSRRQSHIPFTLIGCTFRIAPVSFRLFPSYHSISGRSHRLNISDHFRFVGKEYQQAKSRAFVFLLPACGDTCNSYTRSTDVLWCGNNRGKYKEIYTRSF